MRHRCAAALTASMLSACALAASAGESEVQDTDWVRRIQEAPRAVTYTGVFVYQQGQSVQSSRITHVIDGANSRERLQTLDGAPREILRNNDEVRCLLPDSKTVLIEHRLPRTPFPAMAGFTPQQITALYVVRHTGRARVAELDSDVIELMPRDPLRYGYRLWVDHATGLVLKAQTIDENNDVVEQIAFSEIRIGANVDRNLLKSRWSTDGWKIEDMASSSSPLVNWVVVSPVAGFRKAQEMRRSLPGQPDVGQFVFSDGLAAVSIFIEPMRDGRPSHETVGVQGAINMMARRQGDYWITVLGEVPAATIRQFANAIEYKPSTSKP